MNGTPNLYRTFTPVSASVEIYNLFPPKPLGKGWGQTSANNYIVVALPK